MNSNYYKEWQRNNREKIRGYMAKYRAANREKVLAAGRRYYATHRAEFRKRVLAWAKKNPDKVKAYYGKRIALLAAMALRRNLPTGYITSADTCAALSVSREWLRYLVRQGKIRVKLLGKKNGLRAYNVSDIARLQKSFVTNGGSK